MGTNPTTRRRRTTLVTALALIAVVGGAMFAVAQADAVSDDAAAPVAERAVREPLWPRARVMMPQIHARMGDVRVGPSIAYRGVRAVHQGPRPARDDTLDGGALFARWLERAQVAGPVAPGLVGRVQDGTEVRLHLYDGDPATDGTLLATLTYVAGSDDLASFQAELRDAAPDATHVVVDVLGRTVALPETDAPD